MTFHKSTQEKVTLPEDMTANKRGHGLNYVLCKVICSIDCVCVEKVTI